MLYTWLRHRRSVDSGKLEKNQRRKVGSIHPSCWISCIHSQTQTRPCPSQVFPMRSSLLRMRSSLLRMRSSLVVRAFDCQCTSCNGPGFDPNNRRHSGIWGAEYSTKKIIIKRKKIPPPKKKFRWSRDEAEWFPEDKMLILSATVSRLAGYVNAEEGGVAPAAVHRVRGPCTEWNN